MRVTRALVGDIAFAAVLTVLAILVTSTSGSWDTDIDRPIDAGGYALIALTGVALAVRRRWPVITLVVVAVLTAGYLAAGYPYGPLLFMFFVAVYTVARHSPAATSARASLVALVLILTHLFTNSSALPGYLGVIPATAWVAVPYALGFTIRVRREAVERDRAEALRQRLDDERFRIAQEVHDVMGHGLAAIKMQSDVTLHVMAKKPEEAEAALSRISRISGEALEELRTTLAAVRGAEVEAGRVPGVGLARLDDLCRRMGDAGVQIDVSTAGVPRALPDAVDLAAYRIVQESLTNVLKHGDPKIATVHVEYGTDAVVITVSNPAAQGTGSTTGLGIPGMRRRVGALGGELVAGTADDGQFQVQATIPAGGGE